MSNSAIPQEIRILEQRLRSDLSILQVTFLEDLKDPKTGKYYTGEVSVTGSVDLHSLHLFEIPVKFGKIGGDFTCSNNQLATLENAPSSVGGGFICYDNQLTSLEGAPSSVGGSFSCSRNQLTTLEGIHKLVKKINGIFYIGNNPIKSGGIGLILIEGITRIYADQPAFDIIDKYLGQGKKGLLRCQDELIEAGYEEFAKL